MPNPPEDRNRAIPPASSVTVDGAQDSDSGTPAGPAAGVPVEVVARRLWEQACGEFDYDWDGNATQFRVQAGELLSALYPELADLLEQRCGPSAAVDYLRTEPSDAGQQVTRAELLRAMDDLWGCLGRSEIAHLHPDTVAVAGAVHAVLWHTGDADGAEDAAPPADR